jgi:hypothetical protein
MEDCRVVLSFWYQISSSDSDVLTGKEDPLITNWIHLKAITASFFAFLKDNMLYFSISWNFC